MDHYRLTILQGESELRRSRPSMPQLIHGWDHHGTASGSGGTAGRPPKYSHSSASLYGSNRAPPPHSFHDAPESAFGGGEGRLEVFVAAAEAEQQKRKRKHLERKTTMSVFDAVISRTSSGFRSRLFRFSRVFCFPGSKVFIGSRVSGF